MNLNKNKKRCLIVLFSIFFILTLNSLLLNLKYNQYSNTNDKSSNKHNYFEETNLETQDLSSNNIYSGIGSPWNVTQWANRTDIGLASRFNEGSYDIVEFPLENGWEGYYLDAQIKNLYDTRNWNNGTFAFGSSDAIVAGHNDSARLPHISDNTYQNWTFHSYDNDSMGDAVPNLMSGNYINSGGRDYFELRMNSGSRVIPPITGTWDAYDPGDICMWNSSFYVDRGSVINSTLEFDVNPYYLADISTFALTIYINNQKIYSRSTYHLEQDAGGENNWIHIEFHQSKWKNQSNVFSGNLNDSRVFISIALESSGSNMRVPHGESQILYVDNVELNIRSEVKPSQIGLKLNSTDVNTINYGKGYLQLDASANKWKSFNNKANINFSCTDTWDLSNFIIDLNLDYNFFIIRNGLETNYETNQASYGIKYMVENNSLVNWVWYIYIQVPEGYIQKNISIEFPADFDVTGVFNPTFPSDNIVSIPQVDTSTRGLLVLKINEISLTPDGFWKFEAISPNYCEDLDIFVDESGSWIENNTIISGDRINFRANITKSNSYVDLSNYIDKTYAQLLIKFPNGSVWTSITQYAKSDINGLVNFSSFVISNNPSSPEYIAGEYMAIVTWNNSYSSLGINESGIITKKFIIQHDSILDPDENDYFFEDIINGSSVNIKVSFRDKLDNKYITGANVYALDLSKTKYIFTETSPGFYLYIFDTSAVSTGYLNLTVFANSSLYLNKQINITLDVIQETILSVDNDFLTDVQYLQNFTVRFNYTKKSDPTNLITIDIENDFETGWANGQWYIVQNADLSYNLTCNTTGYVPNVIHSFTFTVNAYKYESQTREIYVLINELDSKMEISVNGTSFSTNDIYNIEVWQKINITARYMDINNKVISDGTVKVLGREGLNKNLTYIPVYNHYSVILNTTDLAEGIDYLNVLGESDKHKSSSLPFIVQITENKTIIEIFLNGANKTADPSLELAYGAQLNITVRYTDIIGAFLDNSLVKLSGDYSDNLIENSTLNQYSLILDSSNLAVGIKIIRLTAEKSNFETQIEDLRIEVRKIRTKVSIEEGDDKIEITSDESVKIAIEVLDLDNNVRIRGAKVEYEWKLKDGEFDEESGGLYETELKDIPEGTYTITILISKAGDQYEFDSIEITLVVREPQEETLLWQILLIIAIIISTAFLAYIIYYIKVLKYPKPVRKVRKYRKSLKRKSPPRISIIEREKAFNEEFNEQTKNISGLKGKSPVGVITIDKIEKKSANKASLKKETKNQKNLSIKKGNLEKKSPDKSKNQSPQKKSQNLNNFIKDNQNSSNNKNKVLKNKFRKKPMSFRKDNKLGLKKKFSGFSNYKKNRRTLFLSLILLFLFLNLNLFSFSNNQNLLFNSGKNNDAINFEETELRGQDLVFYDSVFNNSGIGAPWNVTYYANRTDTGTAEFTNNSFNLLKVQSASGWTGYKLNANIRDLYDRRQWINGTMHYGGGDGTENVDEDDTNDIQDWVFFEVDPSAGADMILTGNYINDSSAISNGHDCLEMRMDGDHFTGLGGDRWSWQTNTRCGWEYTINIPRGKVEDSGFAFDISPIHIAQYTNAWGVTVYVNNYEILFIDLLDLNRIGEGNWGHIEFPQEAWTNSDVFPAQLDGTSTEIEIRLGYYGGSYSYGLEDGPHVDYQQVLIDNVELFIKTEAQPSQVSLQMNQTAVSDLSYGTGTVELEGNWNGTENPFINANFSSYGSGDYGGYQIEFKSDLNLYATKNVPDSYYETDTNSPGTYFTVSNESSVYWEGYGYIVTPTQYEQTEMRVQFPTDLDLTWVSTPQQPTTNVLSSCDNSVNGLLIVPTSLITNPSKPDGFWKLLGTSPNYCEQLIIFRNGTDNPLDNVWNQETIFFSGDYINITAKITDDPDITSTNAILQVRFPNGSIWQPANQLGIIDSDGNVYFNYFMIPANPPYYQSGIYEAIITWNNSYSNRGLNETGLIYKEFTVIHDSILEPDDGNYLIENIVDDSIVNIKVSFRDKEDNTAITNANVYTKNATDILDFSETSPGLYLLEFDTTHAKAGQNNITIYANSTYHLNREINITLDITKQSILTVNNTFLSVPSNENFSITFNYTELNSPETGIDDAELSTNWIDHTFSTISQGYYNLTCNTSAYEANKLHTLILTVKKYRYEPQSIAIRIYVSELGSAISLFVNGSSYSPNDIYSTEVWQDINITVRYEDSFGNHLNGANVSLLGKGEMEETIYDQYTLIINATTLAEDIDTLTIFANISQYNPQTTQFIVEITERKTNIEIWLNNLNKTKDPFIELPIGGVLNLRINYTDSANKHVEDATVRLLGEGLNILLSEDKVAGIYTTNINTDSLTLGTKVLSIDVSKNNYEPIVKNIRTNIRKIRTEVTTEDGDKHYDIRPYENFKLTIEVKNLDFGGKIEDAEVTYSWEFGNGDLKEVDDGVYEITFENVPEGSYTIEISVFKEGGEYDFEDLEITLTARRPEGESFLFLVLFIIAVAVIISLASYYVYYRKVLRYPKPVRKVRKYRRSLKKKSAPSIDIIDRENGFKKVYSEELGKTSKSLKSKVAEEPLVVEKIKKKPVTASTSEGIKKKTIKPPKNKPEK